MNRVYYPDDPEQWFDFDPVWSVADVRAYWQTSNPDDMLTLIRRKIGACNLHTEGGATINHGWQLTENTVLGINADLLTFIGEYVAQFVVNLELPGLEPTHGDA